MDGPRTRIRRKPNVNWITSALPHQHAGSRVDHVAVPIIFGGEMRLLSRIFGPRLEATAHCDLPCGVYDPAQARIEAESVKAIQEKYQGSDDQEFKERAIQIKEERADL